MSVYSILIYVPTVVMMWHLVHSFLFVNCVFFFSFRTFLIFLNWVIFVWKLLLDIVLEQGLKVIWVRRTVGTSLEIIWICAVFTQFITVLCLCFFSFQSIFSFPGSEMTMIFFFGKSNCYRAQKISKKKLHLDSILKYQHHKCHSTF